MTEDGPVDAAVSSPSRLLRVLATSREPGVKGQAHTGVQRTGSCLKIPTFSFPLFSLFPCTRALIHALVHTQTQTLADRHTKGWGRGSPSFAGAFLQPSILLTVLTPKAISLIIYVVVKEGLHPLACSFEL